MSEKSLQLVIFCLSTVVTFLFSQFFNFKFGESILDTIVPPLVLLGVFYVSNFLITYLLVFFLKKSHHDSLLQNENKPSNEQTVFNLMDEMITYSDKVIGVFNEENIHEWIKVDTGEKVFKYIFSHGSFNQHDIDIEFLVKTYKNVFVTAKGLVYVEEQSVTN